MKLFSCRLFLILSIASSACADEKIRGLQEIVVPNIDSESPSCHVRFPAGSIKCTNESCEIPFSKASSLPNIVLFLSCIPSSAPTGFENPAPDVTINSIQTPNASGHFSVIDDSSVAREDRKRHLDFCLYGKKSKFCGSAETILPKNEEPAYITQPIFNFLKTLIFLDGRK